MIKRILIFPAALLVTMVFCFTPLERKRGEFLPAISMNEPVRVSPFKEKDKIQKIISEEKVPPKIKKVSTLNVATPPEPQLALDMSVPEIKIDFSPEVVSNINAPTQGISGGMNTSWNTANMEGVFNAADVDIPPRVKKYIQPVYPPKARGQRIEGTVVVRVIILPDGLPQSIKVISAEPEGYFETAAVETVQRWTFYPAMEGGEKVKVLAEMEIQFNLDN